jgi:hypothetical protein
MPTNTTSNIVQVTQETTEVVVEESRNVVTVDADNPNDVYVSITGSPKRTTLLYGEGAPWTLVVDVEVG